jgi:hypothetical protein
MNSTDSNEPNDPVPSAKSNRTLSAILIVTAIGFVLLIAMNMK